MLENKSLQLAKMYLLNFRKMEDIWDQIEEGNYSPKPVQERTPVKGAYGSKDASSWKFGDFQRSGKQSPGATDRVISWGSAAEAIRSVDHLQSPSPLPLPLPGNEQPICLCPSAGTVSERLSGGFGGCDMQVNQWAPTSGDNWTSVPGQHMLFLIQVTGDGLEVTLHRTACPALSHKQAKDTQRLKWKEWKKNIKGKR